MSVSGVRPFLLCVDLDFMRRPNTKTASNDSNNIIIFSINTYLYKANTFHYNIPYVLQC